MAFELTGFTPSERDGVRRAGRRTTRVDVELGVGALQETVTVSGESPVVDVSSTVTQTNIDKDLYEAIPTGRNPWVMAGLVPGVVTGRLDVGGTEGMQQYNLEAFGSADSQKSFSHRRPQDQLGRRRRRRRRCSTTASRCTRNTTCRRRRAPRRAMSSAST